MFKLQFHHCFWLVGAVCLITAVQYGLSIKCWECRSDADFRCSDPFDNSSFHYTDCDQETLPHLSGRATMCRKIRQKVNGEWRYIRTCAWLSDSDKMLRLGDERYCLIRAGTWDIHIEYCECWSKDGCNSATGADVQLSLFSCLVFINFLYALNLLV